MNTHLRKKAKNDLEKDLFNFMNNVIFGKTLEDVRKHRNLRKHNLSQQKEEGII